MKDNLVSKIISTIIFLIALITYTKTMEPTNSWWDCGEYIITANKKLFDKWKRK